MQHQTSDQEVLACDVFMENIASDDGEAHLVNLGTACWILEQMLHELGSTVSAISLNVDKLVQNTLRDMFEMFAGFHQR